MGWIFQGIEEAVELCHNSAKAAGWWEGVDVNDPTVFSSKLALIHSEISEALEGNRKGLMDDHLPERRSDEVELADAVIRIFDLAGARGMDLEGALAAKFMYNQHRPDHKPENRAKAGGKKI